jgi:hypothetical protein
MVKQISVFIENKKGRLFKLTQALGKENIDLIALSIADTTNFGILRCIVNDPDKAIKVLKDAGFTANTTEVLAVEVPDIPGGLAGVLEKLTQEDISVEYLYSFVRTKNDSALILFRVEEIQKAIDILNKNNINILSEKDVYNI